jgi:hypothetical protein
LTDATGEARLTGIAPGDYLAFAWEAVDEGAWWDPDFLKKHEAEGTAVRVNAAGKHSVTLKLIPLR